MSPLIKLNPWDLNDDSHSSQARAKENAGVQWLIPKSKIPNPPKLAIDSAYDDFVRNIDLTEWSPEQNHQTAPDASSAPQSSPRPKISVREDADGSMVKVHIHGVPKEQIQIDLRDGALVISLKQ